MLSESQAWKFIADDYSNPRSRKEISRYGLCNALDELYYTDDIGDEIDFATKQKMLARIRSEVRSDENSAQGGVSYLIPAPVDRGARAFRATLAYLFSEETK